MAIATTRVYIDQNVFNASKIPVGNTVPTTAAALGTEDIKEDLTFTITSSDFAAASAAAGFDDLFNVHLVGDINTFLSAATGFGIDIVARTVSYNARIKNVAFTNNTDIYLTNANATVVVSIELSVYIS